MSFDHALFFLKNYLIFFNTTFSYYVYILLTDQDFIPKYMAFLYST